MCSGARCLDGPLRFWRPISRSSSHGRWRGKGPLARIGGLSWSLVELAGGWAETSERLSAEEGAELGTAQPQAARRDPGVAARVPTRE
ncbi:MAG: hypothetical protein QOH72_649 [Solirubrobacteraceae bacterium]|nr:hypothetical protein [Solirubrobacteraceae bacterium]